MASSSLAEAGPSRARPPSPIDTESAHIKHSTTDVANGSGVGEGASEAAASTSAVPTATLSFFPTPALDHAFGGIAAGAVATVCMNPLDLIKTKYQVDTSRPRPLAFRQRTATPIYSQAASLTSAGDSTSAADLKGKARAVDAPASRNGALRNAAPVRHGWRYYALGGRIGNDMVGALNDIVKADGWKGLYRGLSPNVAGNSASWGLYFLWYTMIKERMSANASHDAASGEPKKLSAGQHLLAASESGAITALMTNPIWVVKTRMFTTPHSAAPTATATSSAATTRAPPEVYRGLWHGLVSIYRTEGVRGLYKGAGLALFGVSNGAIQFMAYEELKKWRTSVAARKLESNTPSAPIDTSMIQLSNAEYIVMSGVSKVAAILLTYPYQVVRSRIQNHATSHIYPDIGTCIRLTYTQEGLRAFYKGLVPNLVRILPGTCVTFVVYENVSWALKGLARRRMQKQQQQKVEETRSSA
ncbi:Mitochondrial FAD carrier protein FLX1 [Pseudozyma hubeiensis]|nr:Mitochondrial FAD carrier protein FLX1 [Pseudozyma hubeiensis]